MQHEYVPIGGPLSGLSEHLPAVFMEEYGTEECGTEECKLYMLGY